MTKNEKPGPWYVAVFRATRHSLPATTRVSAIPTKPSSTVIPRQKVMRLPVHLCLGSNRPECKEVAIDAFIDCIHFSLCRVAEFMQAPGEDGIHRGEIQCAAQNSHALLAGAGETADGGAGNEVEGAVGERDAVAE